MAGFWIFGSLDLRFVVPGSAVQDGLMSLVIFFGVCKKNTHLFGENRTRPGQKSDSDFWAFLARKIRKSEENQNKNQLTNTSINLGVMGISTLVLHSAYVYQ